ncbi:hypothetical protein E3P99_01416 [Wallemia hederae]|uniref:Uncharacterized protein n=1 Tax=Wallemia hederae TaxID=1540922 RepID=A0A4T0FQQ8_9BASI|nr:hypothetical protein E3P99_01416 [Wallemia hederae]
MRVKFKKLASRQQSLPDGFEGSGLKMADSPSSGSSSSSQGEPDAGGLQFDEDADDVINMPESTDGDSDQPQIDQHQHGNENHNEYSSALAPSLTIGIVAIIIIAAVAVRYMKRKKKLEMMDKDSGQQNDKEKQAQTQVHPDNVSYMQSVHDGDYDTTPPPVYTFLPRSASLNTHSTFGGDQYGTINSVNTMQDLPPTPGPQDDDERSMHDLEPPRRPYVESPPNAHFAPIMPRSSSLGSVSASAPMPRSSSLGSVRSASERVASPGERVDSPFSHSSSHASLPMQSVTPVQVVSPAPSHVVSPPASQSHSQSHSYFPSQPSSPASLSLVKTPPPYAPSPPG